jgi:fatty-acyl-CoA synthase
MRSGPGLDDSTGEPAWVDLCTIGDLLGRGAALHPDRDCVVFPSERLTYRKLDDRAVEVARALLASGVEPGDHVGLLLPNGAGFVELLFALVLIGAVAVPINPRYRPREVGYVVENADLVALIAGGTDDDGNDPSALVAEAFPELADARDPDRLSLATAPRLRTVVGWGRDETPRMVPRAAFLARGSLVNAQTVAVRRRAVALRDRAIMFYTSGTTAMPKGCPLSHEAVVRTGVNTGRYRMRLTGDDRMWNPLPMCHTAFTQAFLAILDAGGTYVTMRRFDARAALEQIEEERVTVAFPAFPTVTMALLNDPAYSVARFAGLRAIFNVAPGDALRRMQQAMPHTVQLSGFGMTEFGGSVVMNRLEETAEERAEVQGHPMPGMEVAIHDVTDPDRPVAQGATGEIVVRGPSAFEGYYRDPVKTQAATGAHGWFHSGDLGSLDAEGRLRYEGRLKDTLKVGGENVAALEIESYLAGHPAVSIAAVVGVPHERLLQVPAAFIELLPGWMLSEEEVLEYCRRGLARFKVPAYVRFVSQWPMSATKVQKFRLREQLLAELGLAEPGDPSGATTQ